MENAVIVAVIVLIIGLAAWYVIRAKKNGAKCIGCPSGCNCSEGGAKTSAKGEDASGSCCSGCCGCGGKGSETTTK